MSRPYGSRSIGSLISLERGISFGGTMQEQVLLLRSVAFVVVHGRVCGSDASLYPDEQGDKCVRRMKKFQKTEKEVEDQLKQVTKQRDKELVFENIELVESDSGNKPLPEHEAGKVWNRLLRWFLSSNGSLKCLELDYCMIGDGGAIGLAEGLEQNRMLQVLNLYGNRISDEGAQRIARALGSPTCVKMSQLRWLSLSMNNIGVDGLMALTEALRAHVKMTTLLIHWNNVDDGLPNEKAFFKARDLLHRRVLENRRRKVNIA